MMVLSIVGMVDYITLMFGNPLELHSQGFRYFVSFIDNFSWRVWVYTMKYKNEVPDIFKK